MRKSYCSGRGLSWVLRALCWFSDSRSARRAAHSSTSPFGRSGAERGIRGRDKQLRVQRGPIPREREQQMVESWLKRAHDVPDRCGHCGNLHGSVRSPRRAKFEITPGPTSARAQWLREPRVRSLGALRVRQQLRPHWSQCLTPPDRLGHTAARRVDPFCAITK
jgi:hypothetical protein